MTTGLKGVEVQIGLHCFLLCDTNFCSLLYRHLTSCTHTAPTPVTYESIVLYCLTSITVISNYLTYLLTYFSSHSLITFSLFIALIKGPRREMDI